MAESGGNWLKLAKSELFGTKKLRKTNNAVGLIDRSLEYLRALFKQRHDGLEVVFWTQVQRSGVQIPLIPRFFLFFI